MPLLFQKQIAAETKLGIWEITETEDFFLSSLNLIASETEQLAILKGRRRLEWLAARYLTHQLMGTANRIPFLKDEFGKPHLSGTNLHISISHSHDLASAIISSKLVGIDIQKIVPKIERIAHKFLTAEEIQNLHVDKRIIHLHIYWCAKEAIYKAYGRKKVDFCNEIKIPSFSPDHDQSQFPGFLLKNSLKTPFQLHYSLLDDFVLVYAIENRLSNTP